MTHGQSLDAAMERSVAASVEYGKAEGAHIRALRSYLDAPSAATIDAMIAARKRADEASAAAALAYAEFVAIRDGNKGDEK